MPSANQAYSTTSIHVCPQCGSETKRGTLHCAQDGAKIVSCPALGAIIFEKYRFDGLIGAGGMGVIYRCRNLYLDKDVAIKTLLGRTVTAEQVLRFQQEAKTTGALNHPAILSINDFGVTGDGNPYMVMEYFPGKTLADHLAKGRIFSILECLDIFEQICCAVSFAHERGVLHRDLKPSNIMLFESDNGRQVKILDFGIAKIADEKSSLQLTKTGEIFGSPAYMSPEQSTGNPVGESSDVYSLGCIFFELLTNSPLFEADSALALMGRHRNDKPPLASEIAIDREIPVELDNLILSMVAKDASDRPQTAAKVKEQLDAIADSVIRLGTVDKGREAHHAQLDTRSAFAHWKLSQTKRANPAWTIVTLLLLLLTPLFFILKPHQDPEQETPLSVRQSPLNAKADIEVAVSKQMKEVWLAMQVLTESDFEAIAADRKLNVLMLTESSGVTRAGLSHLKDLPIHKLVLVRSDVDDEALKAIADFKSLDDLDLEGCENIDDAGLSNLCRKSRSLSVIHLGGTQVTGKGLAYLSVMPNLHGMFLSLEPLYKNHLQDGDIVALRKIPSLRSVMLEYQDLVTDESVKTLVSLPQISQLNLSHTKVTARGLGWFQKSKTLKCVYVHECPALPAKDLYRLMSDKTNRVSIIGAFKDPQHVDGLEASGN